MMIDGLSDGPEAAEEERIAKIRRDELADDMRSVMISPSGRRLMYDILTNMGAWDAVYSARQAGRQEASFELIGRIKAVNMKLFLVMIEENEE